jgi:hypothetical protein
MVPPEPMTSETQLWLLSFQLYTDRAAEQTPVFERAQPGVGVSMFAQRSSTVTWMLGNYVVCRQDELLHSNAFSIGLEESTQYTTRFVSGGFALTLRLGADKHAAIGRGILTEVGPTLGEESASNPGGLLGPVVHIASEAELAKQAFTPQTVYLNVKLAFCRACGPRSLRFGR